MEIKSTADISLETINEIIADGKFYDVIIRDSKNYPKGKHYNIFDLLAIKRAGADFLKNCPNRNPKIPDSEKNIFAYIYTKLAYTVEYDDLAYDVNHSNPQFRSYASDFLDEASGLKGPLIWKKALCSGFAEALRNLLAEKGIDAKVMGGWEKQNPNSKEAHGHAWNQVKLDGEWFNCDITVDRQFITQGLVAPCFLKSNYEFSNYQKYPDRILTKIEPAIRSISKEEQQILIHRNQLKINEELKPVEVERHNIPGFLKGILEKLHLINNTSQFGDD